MFVTKETCSLQFAIYKTFNHWLTKRFTLANFGCGLDITLNTISVPRKFTNIPEQILKDEEEIRQLMINYALNDCLPVTKLVHQLPSPTESKFTRPSILNVLELISDDELPLDDKPEPINKWKINVFNYDVNVYAQNDIVKLHDDFKIDSKPVCGTFTGSHVRDDSLVEIISDDDVDISLPEIMKPYLIPKQHQSNDFLSHNDGRGKKNVRHDDIKMISNEDGHQQMDTNNKHQQHLRLTRN